MLKEFKPELEAILEQGKTKAKPVTATVKEFGAKTESKPEPKQTVIDLTVVDETLDRINYLQEFCLINRVLYYVLDRPVISDYEYDHKENELKSLRAGYPDLWEESDYRDFCPTETVGSSLDDSYPEEIVYLAKEAILNYQDLKAYMDTV